MTLSNTDNGFNTVEHLHAIARLIATDPDRARSLTYELINKLTKTEKRIVILKSGPHLAKLQRGHAGQWKHVKFLSSKELSILKSQGISYTFET